MRKNLIEELMKITQTQTSYQHLTSNQNLSKKAEDDMAKSTSLPASSQPLLEALKDAQVQLSSMPDVDLEKVAELKAAIKEGQIKLDPAALAQAMLKYHQGL